MKVETKYPDREFCSYQFYFFTKRRWLYDVALLLDVKRRWYETDYFIKKRLMIVIKEKYGYAG